MRMSATRLLRLTCLTLLSFPFAIACSVSAHDGANQLSNGLPPLDKVLAPNSANVELGKDFVDAEGRLWKCMGKAVFKSVDAEAIFDNLKASQATSAPLQTPPALTVEEIAKRLQPVRLVGEYEYRLAEPDMLLAQRIVAMKAVPPTDSYKYDPTPPNPAELRQPGAVQLQHIIGTDDRWLHYPSYASAWGRMSQNCTFTMIGPSTALTAAHCVYQCGSWISGSQLYLSAYNHGSTSGNAVFPNGSTGWQPDTVTLPGAWADNTTGAGGTNCNNQTASSHPGWDDDYAILEMSPTRYPGYTSGWMGTENVLDHTNRIVGYPIDKVLWAQC